MKNNREKMKNRARRVRNRLGMAAAGRPRLSVFRSNKNIYAQIIDDGAGKTVASASTLETEFSKSKAGNAASKGAAIGVGKTVAAREKKTGVTEVVFDRGSYLFHGRVKALADSAREHGLKF